MRNWTVRKATQTLAALVLFWMSPNLSAGGDVVRRTESRSKQHDLAPTPATRTPVALHTQPLAFIENRGQFDSRVRYQIRIHEQTAWLTDNGIVFDTVHAKPNAVEHQTGLDHHAAPSLDRFAFEEQFVGASRPSSVEPLECQGPKYSLFYR